MKLGAIVGMRDNPESFARQAKRLEDAGVGYLWAGEAYTADAVSAMGFLAAVTSTAQIGSSILPLYTRTPALLAMTAVGLDKLSGGRFILGLGVSHRPALEARGIEMGNARERLRRDTNLIRKTLNGETEKSHERTSL